MFFGIPKCYGKLYLRKIKTNISERMTAFLEGGIEKEMSKN